MRAFIISLALGAAHAGSFATPECVQEYSECQADDECKDNSILLPTYAACRLRIIDTESTKVPCGTLFLGDSNIDAWISSPQFLGSNNAGVASSTCAMIKTWTQDFLDKTQPCTVVLHCGENDLMAGAELGGDTPENTLGHMKDIYHKLKDGNVKRIIFVGAMREPGSCPDPEGEQSTFEELYKIGTEETPSFCNFPVHLEYNELVQNDKELKEDPNFHYIDADGLFFALDPPNPRELYFEADGLHLTKKAYAILNDAVARVMEDTCEDLVCGCDEPSQDAGNSRRLLFGSFPGAPAATCDRSSMGLPCA